MSLALTNLAWKVRLPPSPKMTLLALCEHADDNGLCWPSIARLAQFTCLGERQAKRLVRELEVGGFVRVVGNENGGNHGSTRRYQLDVEKLTSSLPLIGSENVTGDNLTRVTSTTPVQTESEVMTGVTGVTLIFKALDQEQEQEQELRARSKENASRPTDTLFGSGLDYLKRTGSNERSARSFLGLLRRKVGDLEACRLVAEAEAQEISEPLAWLTKASQHRSQPVRKPVPESFGGRHYEGTHDNELPEFLRT